MTVVLAEIEWGALAELIWVAPVTAVSVTLMYALMIMGVARASDARREGAAGIATGYGVLAFVCGVGFLASLVAAIAVIVTG